MSRLTDRLVFAEPARLPVGSDPGNLPVSNTRTEECRTASPN